MWAEAGRTGAAGERLKSCSRTEQINIAFGKNKQRNKKKKHAENMQEAGRRRRRLAVENRVDKVKEKVKGRRKHGGEAREGGSEGGMRKEGGKRLNRRRSGAETASSSQRRKMEGDG